MKDRGQVKGRLWAVSTYFNFGGYASKYINYQLFRAKLSAPLLTLEIGVDGKFELADRDADILIQLPRGDVMWQQHRLFNVAVGALPTDCDAVAFLDGDLIFDSPDWVRNTLKQLDKTLLVQPFSQVQRLLPFQIPGCVRNGEAVPSIGPQPAVALNASGTTGIGWAVRRELAEEGLFYDAAVLGGSDRLSIHAAFGDVDNVTKVVPLSDAHSRHYRSWAQRQYKRIAGSVGCAEGTVFSLWHGAGVNRQYGSRHLGFLHFGFDPEQDISGSGQAWVWSSDKPDMHRYVREYFYSRYEDGELMMGFVNDRPAKIMKL